MFAIGGTWYVWFLKSTSFLLITITEAGNAALLGIANSESDVLED